MKKLNLLLIVIASIGGIFCSINPIINGNIYKVLICLSIIPVMLVPKILKKLFKLNLTDSVELIYLIFVFFAHFLGSIVNFYHTINNYDKIIHLASGTVSAFFGLYLLINFKKHDHKSILFNVLYIIAFTLMIASFWEFFEYFNDNLFDKDAQNVLTTGVDDTMKDMIAALIGSILFNIMYIYEAKTGNDFLINKFIKEVENK